MLSIFLLSVDSIFAGAALRFFGTSQKYLTVACGAVGLADCTALLLGRAFRDMIATGISISDQRVLLAGCALASIILGKAGARYPRSRVIGVAFLFSIDNLLAGVRMSSLGSTLLPGCAAGIFSGIFCLAGFHCVHCLAIQLRSRAAFVVASVVVVSSFLVF